jgi:hypothetical protein
MADHLHVPASEILRKGLRQLIKRNAPQDSINRIWIEHGNEIKRINSLKETTTKTTNHVQHTTN